MANINMKSNGVHWRLGIHNKHNFQLSNEADEILIALPPFANIVHFLESQMRGWHGDITKESMHKGVFGR